MPKNFARKRDQRYILYRIQCVTTRAGQNDFSEEPPATETSGRRSPKTQTTTIKYINTPNSSNANDISSGQMKSEDVVVSRFSTWTDFNNREDGGLERKFTLTNIMIYYTTGSIVSSMRFYKENLKTNIENRLDNKTGVYVPTGLAAFPNELMHVPQSWARDRFRNIYSYSYMPRGGHFAAFEEPQLLADDLLQFVKKVEKL
ncbi:epoxide hydrolase 1-like [Salvelinus namaycush]|uniref:Epoxide hydrolase 1-like n=1 Tax=Salvelinus namaycush TaxID=8040 RepID=A0A8U0QEZ0_SALNM|nr:epoxide hydrolase 1-like [Salvelinus namaycush]